MRSVAGLFAGGLSKTWAVNSTTTSFASKVPAVAEPTNDGVMDLSPASSFVVPECICLIPYGTGDANDVFDMRVIGWRLISTLWVPTPLLKVTCTLGASTGVAGAAVVATELFCDTIAGAAIGVENVTYVLHSPADDTIAHILLKTEGCRKIETIFDATTGDPSGMNCLLAQV